MSTPTYEVFAIKYAERGNWRRNAFQGGDAHDGPLAMNYFVWLIKNDQRTVIVDLGMTAEIAAKRKRTYLRSPVEGLRQMGVRVEEVRDVIVTHLHYDHVGTYADFPNARFHVQDDEMSYATGRYMQFQRFKHGYEVDDVVGMVRLVYENKVAFCNGEDEVVPGITIHRIGGHTMGCQCVRVFTKRGWIVLASDCSHYYENFESMRAYGSLQNVGEQLIGFQTMQKLAESPQHIIPGHDPMVMQRYSAPASQFEGFVVRLDTAPNKQA
jgi:glyoxylase-like metal-dependent hydrolase (beta-lactamase superfamily II)